MGIPIYNEILFNLLFAYDQVILAGNEDDANYMLRKLKQKYEKWGLTINLSKTEYMKVGEDTITTNGY